METGSAWAELMKVKDQLLLDEEIFYSLLYAYLAEPAKYHPSRFAAYLNYYMASIFDGDVEAERARLRRMGLVQLEEEVRFRKLPLRPTMNELARRCGVDDARWLSCWQLAKILYELRKEEK